MNRGDVVVRCGGPNPAAGYVVSAYPGPGQLTCATRIDAEKLAMAYAKHAGVDAWFDQGPGGLLRLSQFRQPAGQHLEPAPVRPRLAL